MLFDSVIITTILVSTLLAFARGFSREISSLLAFLIALIATLFAFKTGREFLLTYIQPDWLSDLTLIAVSFLISYVFSFFFISQWRKVLLPANDKGALPSLDMFLGLIFGFIRGCLISALLLISVQSTLSADLQEKYMANSFSHPYILKISRMLSPLLPRAKKALEEFTEDI